MEVQGKQEIVPYSGMETDLPHPVNKKVSIFRDQEIAGICRAELRTLLTAS